MTLFHSTLSTPFGPFSIATDDGGRVRFSAFGPLAALQARAAGPADVSWKPAGPRHAGIAEEVLEYAAGGRRTFSVPVRAMGSSFQQRVWTALQAIPPGETRSYGDVARILATAPRAVGRANATNPACLFIPCHRVIGGNGSLTGFAFGNALKERLLRHEAAWRQNRTQVASLPADKVAS